ncbi:MAG TPA: hypothetical protein VGA85_06755 [Dehalococcoidales bacterium]
MPEIEKQPENQLEKYIHEIDECGKPIIQKLSLTYGKDTIARYLYYLEKHSTLSEREPPEHSRPGSVLCGDDIQALCTGDVPLIDCPEKNPKKEAASYQLRLGSRCRVVDSKLSDPDGIVWLSDSRKDLHIRPHSIVIVSTYEWLNMPGCLIGRWNLKVKKVYDGLVWVGSLQVDPGYQGFLFCPIYNLSNDEQILLYKDPLFIIDFVLTTPNKDGKYSIWQPPPDRDKYSTFDFDRLDEKKIKSAPEESFNKIYRTLKISDKKAEEANINLENKMERQNQFNLILIGILFTAIGVIAGFGLGTVTWYADWIPTVLMAFSLVLSGIALYYSVFKKPKGDSKDKENSHGNSGTTK